MFLFDSSKFNCVNCVTCQEKDSYIEMWQSATQELEKLQNLDRVGQQWESQPQRVPVFLFSFVYMYDCTCISLQ